MHLIGFLRIKSVNNYKICRKVSAQNVKLSISLLFGPLLPAFPFKIKILLQGGINTNLLNELMDQ